MVDNDLALICGADAIATALEITKSQFYQSRHQGGLSFVWREPGVGLVTTRCAIRAYMTARASGQEPAKFGDKSAPLDKVA